MAGAKIGWKLVLMVFTLVVQLVTKRALTSAWKLGSGRKPPKNPRAHDAGYAEVVGWAVASGATAAVAKRFAEQRATRYWENSTGTTPPSKEKRD